MKKTGKAKGLKVCPKCGKSFECQSDQDCWCENVQIHKKEMIMLMHDFTDCLCPDCLSLYTEKP